MNGLGRRLARLEAIHNIDSVPTHEQCLFALERLENPAEGYTDAQRQVDIDVLRRWNAAAYAAGLLTADDLIAAGGASFT